jgi:hypothetical protein
MTNALFNFGKQHLLDGDFILNAGGSTMKTHLHDDGTATGGAAGPVLPTTDTNYGDIKPGMKPGGVNQTLASLSTVGPNPPGTAPGTWDAADVVYSNLPGPESVECIVIYKDSGADATSWLLVFLDSGTNMPFTPNGGNVTIQWSASGIFAI